MSALPPSQYSQQALDAEARFEAMLSMHEDGIMIIDGAGRIRHVNDALRHLLGAETSQLLGHAIQEFIPADLGERVLQCLSSSEGLGTPDAPVAFRLQRWDGSSVEVEANGRRVMQGPDAWLAVVVRPAATRRQLEFALDASRQRLRSTFDALAEGVVVQDREGRIVDSNAAASSILGLDADQIVGRTSLDARWGAVHEDGSAFAGDMHPAMITLRTGRAFQEVVMGVHRPDGALKWLSINAVPLIDATQTVVGAVTSFFDITERKANERALEAQRALNERIIETSPFGICIYDEHGDCLAANPAMARDIGASLPQVRAQNYHRLASWKTTGFHDLALRALECDEPLSLAAPAVTSFGKSAWLELTCRALDLGGRRGLMVVTRDLTEARRAEDELQRSEIKYRTLVQQATDGIFVATPDGRYTEVNDAGCRMVGYSRAEILRMCIGDLVEPEDLRRRPIQYERMRNNMPVLSERNLRRKDGSILVAEISGSALPDGNFLGIVRDIGQRRAAEEAMRAQAVAERSDKAKSEFVSRMSHELRNPLNAILGYSELFQHDREGVLSGEQEARIGHIRRAGRHLLQLIDDLLSMSRIEAGAVRLELQSLDVRALMAEAIAELAPAAARADVRLTLQLPTSAPLYIRADPTRLLQVMTNLVSNAVKYNRAGGTVTVKAQAQGDRMEVSVADDGPGMSSPQLQRLFRPFDRLGREGTDVEGTGIGLVITRGLVNLMGGHLSVTSVPESGSEFVVNLPRGLPPDTPDPAGATPPAACRRDDVKGRVVYIEDDEVNRLLMQSYLSLRPNVQLTLARDGVSGIRAAQDVAPDVVLIDMTLPDMNGLDVLRMLRTRAGPRRIFCVAVSGNAMLDDIAAADAAGIDAYLTKPVSAWDLLSKLDELLAPGHEG
jgi:PAS domain S-box-containing protein